MGEPSWELLRLLSDRRNHVKRAASPHKQGSHCVRKHHPAKTKGRLKATTVEAVVVVAATTDLLSMQVLNYHAFPAAFPAAVPAAVCVAVCVAAVLTARGPGPGTVFSCGDCNAPGTHTPKTNKHSKAVQIPPPGVCENQQIRAEDKAKDKAEDKAEDKRERANLVIVVSASACFLKMSRLVWSQFQAVVVCVACTVLCANKRINKPSNLVACSSSGFVHKA